MKLKSRQTCVVGLILIVTTALLTMGIVELSNTSKQLSAYSNTLLSIDCRIMGINVINKQDVELIGIVNMRSNIQDQITYWSFAAFTWPINDNTSLIDSEQMMLDIYTPGTNGDCLIEFNSQNQYAGVNWNVDPFYNLINERDQANNLIYSGLGTLTLLIIAVLYVCVSKPVTVAARPRVEQSTMSALSEISIDPN